MLRLRGHAQGVRGQFRNRDSSVMSHFLYLCGMGFVPTRSLRRLSVGFNSIHSNGRIAQMTDSFCYVTTAYFRNLRISCVKMTQLGTASSSDESQRLY